LYLVFAQTYVPRTNASSSETWTIKARDARRITAEEMKIHEKNSRIHLDTLQNKYTDCKGIKYNNNFGKITGIQEKLDTTCK